MPGRWLTSTSSRLAEPSSFMTQIPLPDGYTICPA